MRNICFLQIFLNATLSPHTSQSPQRSTSVPYVHFPMTKLHQFSATTQLLRAWTAGAVLMLPAIWKGDLKGCVRILSAQENPKKGTDGSVSPAPRHRGYW